MNEQDYIDATNLAKARIAQSIIYDFWQSMRKMRKIAVLHCQQSLKLLDALKRRLRATHNADYVNISMSAIASKIMPRFLRSGTNGQSLFRVSPDS